LIKQAATAIDRFFFAPMPPYAMATFRILYGLMALAYAILLSPDFFTWFGSRGLLSFQTACLFSQIPCIKLLNIVPVSDNTLVAFYSLFIVAIVCLIFGIRTRLSAALVLICEASFLHRNPCIIDAGDVLLPIGAFHLMLSSAGQVWSVDSFNRRRQGNPYPAVSEPWAQRLYQLQINYLYFVAFWTKLKSPSWLDGSELYYVLRSSNLAHLPMPFIGDHLWACQAMTWLVLAIELSLWTLIWVPRFRYYALAGGVALHLGIDYALNLPVFQWLLISGLVVFVEPAKIVTFVSRILEGKLWSAVAQGREFK
jgi:hypothetical protein